MKIILTLLTIGLLTGFVAGLFLKSSESNISQVKIGERIWDVEVVSSLQDRTKGLSDRASLEEGVGMLFVFPDSKTHGIWMKDMNFNIDIIWIDENLSVVGLKAMATPESYPNIFKSSIPVPYVLEVNAGEAGNGQIKIGDMVSFF